MPTPSDPYLSLIQAGVEAMRAGDRHAARRSFRAAVTLDPRQKRGWLALAQLETDPRKKARYYDRVLKIDPQDAVASAYMAGVSASRSRAYLPALGLVALVVVVGGAILALARQTSSPTETLPTQAQLPSATPVIAVTTGETQPEATEARAVLLEANAESTAETGESLTSTPLATATVRFAIASASPAPSLTAATETPFSVTVFFVAPPTFPPTATFFPTETRRPTSSGQFNVSTSTPTRTRTPTPTSTGGLFQQIEPRETNEAPPTFVTATPDYEIDYDTPIPDTGESYEVDPLSGGGSPRRTPGAS